MMAERQVALVPTMIQLDNFEGYADAGEAKFPGVRAAHAGALRPPVETFAAAYDAGVPIYAGTDAGGYLPHGLVGQRDRRVGASSCRPSTRSAAGSWRARAWLGRPRHPRPRRARPIWSCSTRTPPRPEVLIRPPRRSCCAASVVVPSGRDNCGGRWRSWVARARPGGAGRLHVDRGRGPTGDRDRPSGARHPESRTAGRWILDVSLLTTEPGEARPAIVLAHGFGGSKADSAGIGRTLARDGYTVITYTARGFGTSGGLIHLDHPAYEGGDTAQDGRLGRRTTRGEPSGRTDDPVIGFAGASYGGAVSLLAPGWTAGWTRSCPPSPGRPDPGPRAAVRRSAAAQNSPAAVSPIGQAGVFKQRWASLLLRGPVAARERRRPNPVCVAVPPEICRAYVQTAQRAAPPAGCSAARTNRVARGYCPGSPLRPSSCTGRTTRCSPSIRRTPTSRGLPSSTTKAMAWVVGGHDTEIDLDAQLPKLRSWFDRYLKNQPVATAPAFSVEIPQTRLVGQNAGSRPPQVLTGTEYPLGDDVVPTTIPLIGAEQTLRNPPGGVPAALTSLPGTGEALAAATRVGGYRLAVLPGQTATFVTDPLTAPRSLVGGARITLAVTSSTREATLFASIWDLGPDGSGTQAGQPQTAILPQLRRRAGPRHRADAGPAGHRPDRPARRGPPGPRRAPDPGDDLEHGPGVRGATGGGRLHGGAGWPTRDGDPDAAADHRGHPAPGALGARGRRGRPRPGGDRRADRPDPSRSAGGELTRTRGDPARRRGLARRTGTDQGGRRGVVPGRAGSGRRAAGSQRRRARPPPCGCWSG